MRSPQDVLATMYSSGALSAFTGIILSGEEAARQAVALLGTLNDDADAIEQAASIMEFHRGNLEEAHTRWDLGICPDCQCTMREGMDPALGRCDCSDMIGIACRLSDKDVVLEDV